MADQLGTPFMPWQRLVADVAGEVDGAGLPAYREVVCTVPRQSGKTTLVLAFELHRAIAWRRPTHVAYTAQTGLDARSKMIKDQAPVVMRSPLRAAVGQVLKGAAYTAIEFVNGSRIEALATSSEAGHGKTIGLGVIDEAFADDDDRREQALLPAMTTVADAQLLVFSTAGTDESVLLNRKVEAGRLAVAEGQSSGIAYFEWSAPLEADPDDPATWWACMPALGHTVTEATIRHARATMSDGEFRRAYLNQPTVADDRVIPEGVWLAVQDPTSAPEGRLVFGLDVSPDRRSAAVAVADGAGRVELVEHRPGVSWVVGRVAELAGSWSSPVVVDERSPAGSLADELEAVGVQVVRWALSDVASACGRFYDRVADGDVRVRPSEVLSAAVAGAARRVVSDVWVWGRRASSVDIAPLVAVTLALGEAARPVDVGAPMVSFV